MDCIFCNIISDPSQALVVYDDNDFLAFLDINPINEGHTLLIPKKHTQFIWDMEQNDYNQIFETGKIIQEKLQKAFSPKAVGMAIEGLTVPHTHIHFVPLYNMGELNPMRAKRATKEQLLATFQKINQS